MGTSNGSEPGSTQVVDLDEQRALRTPGRREDLKIAIIGCGTIAELGHMAALEELGLAPTFLFDRDPERIQVLNDLLPQDAQAIGAADYREHLDEFDAAIVAVPHHLHAPIATDLLAHGKHVLLEKPMAITPEECDEIIAAAEASDGVLAIGMIRRFWDSVEWTRAAIAGGAIGEVQSFDIQDGARAITIASDFALKRESSGGGVLMNLGVHVLDEVLLWFGPVASFDYQDDSYGGNEVNALLDLTMESGARGRVELSFNRQMRSTAVIRGTLGELEIELYGQTVKATPESLLKYEANGMAGDQLPPSDPRLAPIFGREIADWLDAALSGGSPRVPGDAHHRVLSQLIQDCYAQRRELDLPWMNPERYLANAGEDAAETEVAHALR